MKKSLTRHISLLVLVGIVAVLFAFALVACSSNSNQQSIEHNFSDWIVAKEATCTETGSRGRKCIDCGYVEVEEIPSLGGHKEIVVRERKEPTCTEAGYTQLTKCSVCGKKLADSEEIPALGHSIVTDSAVEPTETADGLTEGQHCSRCGEILIPQELLPAIVHRFDDEMFVVEEPTCTQAGIGKKVCLDCGKEYQVKIEPLGHDEVVDEGFDSTCAKEGLTDGTHCVRCGEILIAQQTVPKKNHTFGDSEVIAEPTCTQKGQSHKYCQDCGEEAFDDIEALGHIEYVDYGTAPTCTNKGLTDAVYCSRCNEILVQHMMIPALGHDFDSHGQCTRCGFVDAEKQPKYTVKFDSQGGSAVADQIVVENNKLSAPTQPTKTMNIFAGWYKDLQYSAVWDFENDVVTADITLYAKWKADELRITSVDGATINGKNIVMIVEPETEDVDLSDKIIINSPTATWKLYFDKLGKNEIRTKIATLEEGSLNDGSNIFYIVVESADGTQIKTYTLEIYKKYWVEVTIYDQRGEQIDDTWKILTQDDNFEIYFFKYGAGFVGPIGSNNIYGYTFYGWNVIGATIGEPVPKDCTSIKVYADGDPIKSQITYDANGGTVSTQMQIVTFDCTEQLAIPTRDGYEFRGWTIVGDHYYAGTKVCDGTGKCIWQTVGNLTLKAEWRQIKYSVTVENSNESAGTIETRREAHGTRTIHFDLNGGTGDIDDIVIDDSTTTYAYPSNAKKEGYVFAGWYDNKDCKGDVYDFEIIPNVDITLYAKWVAYKGKGALIADIHAREQTVDVKLYEDKVYLDYCYALYPLKTLYGEDNTIISYIVVNKPVLVRVYDEDGHYIPYANTIYNFEELRTFEYELVEGKLYFVYFYQDEGSTLTTSTATIVLDVPFPQPDKYVSGEKCTLTATPNLGYVFDGWYIGDEKISDELEYTYTVGGCDTNIVAKWGLCDGMDVFNFTSTLNSCEITSIKDTTTTNVVIPDFVTSIGNYAFRDCVCLTSVTIPNSVTSIGDYAFYNCSGLTSVTIPDGVTSIGDYAFYGCSGLTFVTIPNSVTSIGSRAFEDCTSLTSVTIPDSVTSIGPSAFSKCSKLSTITVDEGNPMYHSNGNCLIETESKALILGCKNSIIPNDGSVTSIRSYAFGALPESFEIPNNITRISGYAFYYSGIRSTASYGGASYAGNSDNPYMVLIKAESKQIVGCGINENCKIIFSEAFKECTYLESITIPENVIGVGQMAFMDCVRLSSVTIGNNVDYIDSNAFRNCISLRQITIPKNVSQLGRQIFQYCNNISVVIDEDNPVYSSNGNCIIETASKTLIEGFANSVIPKDGSVTSIGADAFNTCTELTSITIPNSVKTIGASAFALTGLKSITIPNSVVLIDAHAFGRCASLTSATISSGVTIISRYLFSDCENLSTIVIPISIKIIEEDAFFNIKSLSNINYGGTKEQWNSIQKERIWKDSKTININCIDGTISI